MGAENSYTLPKKAMDSGNTVFYIVATIIIAHFVAGFVFLVRKLSGPVAEESVEEAGQEPPEAKTEAENRRG